jgi:hypothetical protein
MKEIVAMRIRIAKLEGAMRNVVEFEADYSRETIRGILLDALEASDG